MSARTILIAAATLALAMAPSVADLVEAHKANAPHTGLLWLWLALVLIIAFAVGEELLPKTS